MAKKLEELIEIVYLYTMTSRYKLLLFCQLLYEALNFARALIELLSPADIDLSLKLEPCAQFCDLEYSLVRLYDDLGPLNVFCGNLVVFDFVKHLVDNILE